MTHVEPPDASPPDPRLRARAKALFQEVVELPMAERDPYLARATGADPELRREVAALLEGLAHAEQSWREAPRVGLAGGEMLGPYRMLRPLGSGGFGAVWAAEQMRPVQRQVAVKVLRAGVDSREVVARFEAERQALAVMDHAGVARVFDAGVTGDGRPYFVMELVEGRPITEHCDAAGVPLRERLALFIATCHAVQHAHHKGVIHRDIKPGNVLIAVQEGAAVPKVIDFGIAKAIAREGRFHGVTTEGPQLLGTPEYMAPEQADAGGIDVDARADVYSLGVLLYELLTGTRPFAAGSGGLAGVVEVLRQIREEEPPRPSTRVTTAHGGGEVALARSRATTPRHLVATLRQGLDWIVMKCLAKDRTRRYQTPQELADDIGRFLRHEPLLAGPPSRWYRTRVFLRRHRVLVSAVVLVVLSLAIGLGFASAGYRAARARELDAETEKGLAIAARRNEQEERERAAAQARKAQAVVTVLRRLLGSSDPHQSRGRDFTVRALLEEFDREQLGGGLAQEPEVEAAIRATVGRAWMGLGASDKAEAHLRRALELRREHCGAQSAEAAESGLDWAENLHNVGKYREGLALVAEVLAIPSLHDLDPEANGQALSLQADLLYHLGELAQAETAAQEALAVLVARNGPEHGSVAAVRNILGLTLLARGNAAQAAAVFRELVQAHIRLHGKEHVVVATSLHNLADALSGSQQLQEAERLGRRALLMQRRLLPARHRDIARSEVLLGQTLRRLGRLDEAGQYVPSGLATMRAVYGEQDHDDVVGALQCLADLQHAQGNHAAALASYRAAVAMGERMHGPGHHRAAPLRIRIGDVLASLADWRAAEAEYRTAVDQLRRAYGADNRWVAIAMTGLGFVLALQERFAEAEPLCRDALASHRRHVPPEHPDIALNLINVAHVLTYLDRFGEAEPHYREAIELRRGALGPRHLQVASPLNGLGQMYERSGDLARAVATHKEALEILEHGLDAADPQLAAGRRRMGRLLLQAGRPADAQPHLAARVARDRAVRGLDPLVLADSLQDLGICLLRQDLAVPAVAALGECLDIRERAGAGSRLLADAVALLGHALFLAGNAPAAEPLLVAYVTALVPNGGGTASAERIGWLAQLYEATARPVAGAVLRQATSTR